ncbi:hypothetical protein C7T94_13775 [Pedobacter yulinensis]|uniref:Uncharacterized protein n=1 Tax=Pedobacter yulinensis TaxID=2126353 RepID=A0A2T3HMD8_9SPHI|nr:hypothetical protein C7T94_13775 [Pedobacter yulinensis]
MAARYFFAAKRLASGLQEACQTANIKDAGSEPACCYKPKNFAILPARYCHFGKIRNAGAATAMAFDCCLYRNGCCDVFIFIYTSSAK